tara:strand:- start:1672 stop:2412 length:741 start_codon:yes stop_codon:yes gene_type:complete
MSEESLIKTTEATEETEVTEEKDFVTAEDQEVRPEWLPEKFKSPEAFAESYSSLEKKFHQKEEDLRSAWDAELQEKAFENRPKTADEYELPETIDEALGADNKLLGWWSKFSWDNGLSQDEFSEGIEIFKNEYLGEQKSADDEIQKLGDNGQERIQAAELWANKFFPENLMPAVVRLAETSEGIEAMEMIMETLKGNQSLQSESNNKLDEDMIKQMMDDERYHNPAKRDPNLVRQVNESYAKLFPD